MNELEQVTEKLARALGLIKEAVDQSLSLMGRDPGRAKQVTVLWEDFLRDFLAYIKQRGKETRRNLFAAVSFHRVWPR